MLTGASCDRLRNFAYSTAQANEKLLAEQQGVAYTKIVAEAMNLELDIDNPADREKLRRSVLDPVAGRKITKSIWAEIRTAYASGIGLREIAQLRPSRSRHFTAFESRRRKE